MATHSPLIKVMLTMMLSSMSINLYADINLSAVQGLQATDSANLNFSTTKKTNNPFGLSSDYKYCKDYSDLYILLMASNRQCGLPESQKKVDEFEAAFIQDCPVTNIMALKLKYAQMNNTAVTPSDQKTEQNPKQAEVCDAAINYANNLINLIHTNHQKRVAALTPQSTPFSSSADNQSSTTQSPPVPPANNP